MCISLQAALRIADTATIEPLINLRDHDVVISRGLQPNSLTNDKYANPEYYLVRIIAVSIILIGVITVFIIYRKKRKKNLKNEVLS